MNRRSIFRLLGAAALCPAPPPGSLPLAPQDCGPMMACSRIVFDPEAYEGELWWYHFSADGKLLSRFKLGLDNGIVEV